MAYPNSPNDNEKVVINSLTDLTYFMENMAPRRYQYEWMAYGDFYAKQIRSRAICGSWGLDNDQ